MRLQIKVPNTPTAITLLYDKHHTSDMAHCRWLRSTFSRPLLSRNHYEKKQHILKQNSKAQCNEITIYFLFLKRYLETVLSRKGGKHWFIFNQMCTMPLIFISNYAIPNHHRGLCFNQVTLYMFKP